MHRPKGIYSLDRHNIKDVCTRLVPTCLNPENSKNLCWSQGNDRCSYGVYLHHTCYMYIQQVCQYTHVGADVACSIKNGIFRSLNRGTSNCEFPLFYIYALLNRKSNYPTRERRKYIKNMAQVYRVPAQGEISHQELKSIKIENLKCLKNLEIDFSEKPMVAIMAPNGCGKSSILHALYCSFNIPNTSAEVNYFSRFFRPTNLNKWNNSKFTIEYSFQRRGVDSGILSKEYLKTQQRWCRYEDRPVRHTEFIGIETCVPSIEYYASKRGSTF